VAVWVGIIMGSASDWETMRPAAEVLDALSIAHEVRVVSAHRTPDLLFEYAASARARGLEAIIAGAGGAAHLPGMVAAMTPLPHRTRLSASRARRNAALPAPRAERTASSDSRRTVRASTRLATFEHAITNSSPEAANRTHKTVLARELIWSCMRVTSIL